MMLVQAQRPAVLTMARVASQAEPAMPTNDIDFTNHALAQFEIIPGFFIRQLDNLTHKFMTGYAGEIIIAFQHFQIS
jgi:hypothetical protein